MSKTILMIHGRHFKPPEAALKKHWVESLRFGIERDHSDKLPDFDAAVKEFIYFGDISNKFLSEKLNQPIPNDIASRKKTLEDLKSIEKISSQRAITTSSPEKIR